MNERIKKINEFIKIVLKEDKPLRPELYIVEDLGFDSIKILELIHLLEEEFDVLIPLNNIAHIQTIQELYEAVEHIEDLN